MLSPDNQSMQSVDTPQIILVAQRESSSQSTASAAHVMGVCKLVMLDDHGDSDESVPNPIVYAEKYFKEIYK